MQVVFIIAAELARGQESLRMTRQECDDVFRVRFVFELCFVISLQNGEM